MLSETSRLLLKLKSTDEYCYILFSAFNKFAEEPKNSAQLNGRIAMNSSINSTEKEQNSFLLLADNSFYE